MPKIAIQGIETSFHDVAAKKYFGEHIELDECMSFTKLCESLKSNGSDFAVMAIENSIAGSLLQNYGLLQEYNFHIIGEVFLRIEMNLMSLPGQKLDDIKTVQSHPIAIRQCSKYLQRLTGATLLEKEDTAACAQEIAEKQLEGFAAVANIAAAAKFGLNVLAKNIETNKNNFTRFVVLGKSANENKKNNKATLMFSLNHEQGSLAAVLNLFTEHKINLTKIQSVPIVGLPYKYNFHVDIEWSAYDNFQSIKKSIVSLTENFQVLGEYTHGDFDSIKNT
ncbi:MAG: prephenate dehydratase [Saprospiraceae bacterium]|jgi:prephenate dehydratase